MGVLAESKAQVLVLLLVPDWVLRSDGGATLDGDSLSYLDMVERNSAEERRRARERVMMEEGTALWKAKKSEELELELRDQEKVGAAPCTHVYSEGRAIIGNRKL